jgi:hypothetical protein
MLLSEEFTPHFEVQGVKTAVLFREFVYEVVEESISRSFEVRSLCQHRTYCSFKRGPPGQTGACFDDSHPKNELRQMELCARHLEHT